MKITPVIHGQLHDVIDYIKLIEMQAKKTNGQMKIVSFKESRKTGFKRINIKRKMLRK